MVKIKRLTMAMLLVVMLLVTVIGALAEEQDSLVVEQIVQEGDEFVFDYELVTSDNVARFSCDFYLDGDFVFGDVTSLPGEVNRVREELDLSGEEHVFKIVCSANEDVVLESKNYLLQLEEQDENVSREGLNNSQSEEEERTNNPMVENVFYFVVILIAVILLVKNFKPKTTKKKNKRLRKL